MAARVHRARLQRHACARSYLLASTAHALKEQHRVACCREKRCIVGRAADSHRRRKALAVARGRTDQACKVGERRARALHARSVVCQLREPYERKAHGCAVDRVFVWPAARRPSDPSEHVKASRVERRVVLGRGLAGKSCSGVLNHRTGRRECQVPAPVVFCC
jgi:hypothetical protein